LLLWLMFFLEGERSGEKVFVRRTDQAFTSAAHNTTASVFVRTTETFATKRTPFGLNIYRSKAFLFFDGATVISQTECDMALAFARLPNSNRE
jgi:hypothetical protein